MPRRNGYSIATFVALALGLLGLAIPSPINAQKEKPQTQTKRVDSFGDPLPEGVLYRIGTTRLRHRDLRQLRFCMDGKHLISHSGLTNARTWNIETGEMLKELPETTGNGWLEISPDETYVACVNDKTLLLLNKDNGKQFGSWEHKDGWGAWGFAADSKTLVAISKDAIVYRWDLASRKEIARQPLLNVPKADGLLAYDFWELSPDCTVVAGAELEWDGPRFPGVKVKTKQKHPWRFWDTVTGKECRKPIVGGRITQWGCFCRWSADGNLLAIRDALGVVDVWDTLAHKRVWSHGDKKKPGNELKDLFNDFIATGSYISAVAFHPDGKRIVIGDQDKVSLRSLADGKVVWEKSPSSGGKVLAFSRDGKLLSAGSFGPIAVLDAETGASVGFTKKDPGQFGFSRSLEMWFTPDGNAAFIPKGDGFLLHETQTGKALLQMRADRIIAVSGDAKYAVLGENRDIGKFDIRLIELGSGKELWRHEHGNWCEASFAPDSKTLAVCAPYAGVLSILDAISGKEVKRICVPDFDKANEASATIAVFPDFTKAIIRKQNGESFCIVDLATGKQIAEWKCPEKWSACQLHFLPGGKQILCDGYDRNNRTTNMKLTCVLDANSGKVVYALDGQLGWWLRNGRLAMVYTDWTNKVLEVESGRLHNAPGHIWYAGFSPDGRHFAIVDTRRELSVFKTDGGTLLRRWESGPENYYSVNFSPDGRYVFVECSPGTFSVYDVATFVGK